MCNIGENCRDALRPLLSHNIKDVVRRTIFAILTHIQYYPGPYTVYNQSRQGDIEGHTYSKFIGREGTDTVSLLGQGELGHAPLGLSVVGHSPTQ